MLTLSDYLGIFFLLLLVIGIATSPRPRGGRGVVHKPRPSVLPPRPPPPAGTNPGAGS